MSETSSHPSTLAVHSLASSLLAVTFLWGCAAAPNRSPVETKPDYQVTGSVGLIFRLPTPAIGVRPAERDAAAELASEAERKRKEASRGPGVIALTIATAPLALLSPLYPPAIQLAALPFVAVKATIDAGKDADRLQQEATAARRNVECTERLDAAHPGLAESLAEVVRGPALHEALQAQIGDALQLRTHAPIVPFAVQRGAGPEQGRAFLSEASERRLSTVVEIEVEALDLSGESAGVDGECRYQVVARGNASWWNVATRSTEVRSDLFPREAIMPIAVVDLRPLLDDPEALRTALALKIRDAMLGTLDGSRVRFLNQPSAP